MVCSKLSDNNTFNNVVGIGAGYGTYKVGKKVIGFPVRSYLESTLSSYSPEENAMMFNAGEKTLDNSWLKSKGITMQHLDTKNVHEIIEELNKKNAESNKGIPKCISFIFDKLLHEPQIEAVKEIAEGKNACYAPGLKRVLVNKDKMSFSVFHELGHAINDQCKGWKHGIKNCSIIGGLLITPILLTALIHKSKEDEADKNKKQKCLDFIKNNCGKLVFACSVPVMLEEGLASINAVKLAKQVLPKEKVSKMNKMNAKAWCSYLLSGITMGLMANLAVYVRDKVSSRNA